ncbi:hypothetical protein [Halorussus salinisoli]|uniref:hypothetical protein n=1 Tax=Halorussus salinisoli TaxID=2558242 RepID=UPI0010C22626|nr:hypothetical protein [Halorussus salinisoli]
MTQSFELPQRCQREVGNALRIAAVYTATGFDNLYLREDLDQQYTPAEIETLRRELIVFALGKETLADVTHAGKFRRIICQTEDALALQVPIDGHFGVFVSIDFSAKDSLFDIGDIVQAWIEQEELSAEETNKR